MNAIALLCNHAEVQNNLLYISGAGIDRANVAPGAPAPYAVNVAIAIQVTVPWVSTDQDHTLAVNLVDADSRPVTVQISADERAQIRAELRFNVGQPQGLDAMEDQRMHFAIAMPGLPLPSLGSYSFLVSIDGVDVQILHYRVVMAPGQVPPGTSGPADIPNF